MPSRHYVADRRQWGVHSKTGQRYLSGGGWMVMWWDERREAWVEGDPHTTKRQALDALRQATMEDRERSARSAAAAALGRRGGQVTGAAKARGGSDYYRELAARRKGRSGTERPGVQMPRAEYLAWWNARKRCVEPTDPNWKNYGGRGITMCDEWCVSFWAFLDHVGPRPAKGLSLDRIENSRGYEPGNVRWATARQQVANARGRSGRPKKVIA